jgi:hypothetical protein
LQVKIDRIIAQIATKKDKDWLQNKLQHAGEPNLASRLYEIFIDLPFGLEEKRLRDFSVKCADVRNDLAHLGGKRTREKNANYLNEIEKLSSALTFLYHMTLLREIGVLDENLKKWLYSSFKSFPLKTSLVEAQLLAPETILPKSISQNTSEH